MHYNIRMEEKRTRTALITGANTGMGKATAIALARAGMRVVMLCRSQARGERARADIMAEGGGAQVDLMLCDLGEMAQIRAFCAQFRQRYDQLDVLVCNAGVLCMRREETADGLEMHFGINHISHYLLANLLLDLMPPASRIVVVGSVAHYVGRINFDDLGMRKGYNVIAGYGRAKLCNLLFTRALARRLEGAGITVNCAHPGAVATSIVINRKTGFGKTLTKALGWIARTPAQGAATAIYLASDPACEGVTGGYFARCKPARSSKRSKDMALAERLWAVSAQITGLDEAGRRTL